MGKISVDIVSSEDDLDRAFFVRQKVFVEEQKVSAEEEFDEFEKQSRHFLARNGKLEPVGTARWRSTAEGIKLERFAVLNSARGTGVGSALVESVLMDIKSQKGTDQSLYLHAQLSAVPLYKKFGFKEIGHHFLECDIWHVAMKKNI